MPPPADNCHSAVPSIGRRSAGRPKRSSYQESAPSKSSTSTCARTFSYFISLLASSGDSGELVSLKVLTAPATETHRPPDGSSPRWVTVVTQSSHSTSNGCFYTISPIEGHTVAGGERMTRTWLNRFLG